MSELFFDLSGEYDPAPPAPFTVPRVMDARDLPSPGATGELEPDADFPGSAATPAGDPTDQHFPITHQRAIPTRPAAGRIIAAGTLELTGTETRGDLIGREPGHITAATVAYLMVRVDGVVTIGPDPSALTYSRAEFGADGGTWIILPHLAGMYVFAAGAAATVSWFLVGALS